MHPTVRPAALSQLQSLQILRGVAAVSVVYFHIGKGTTFGSFGVDLFFVLSGFVIAMVSEKNIGATQFAINRITRVVPLYWLMTTLLMTVLILRPELFNSTTANIPNYFKSIFFIPYFNDNGQLQPLLGVGWTLNYEMVFYAMAAISLSVSPTRFYYVTCALVALLFGIGYLLLAGTPYADFLRSTLLFEFLLGMAAFKLKDSAYLGKIPLWIIAIAILFLYAIMSLIEIGGFKDRFIPFGIPSFLVVLLTIRLEPLLSRLNSVFSKILIHLGDASYATYLSHTISIELVHRFLPRITNGLTMESKLGTAIAVSFSIIVGGLIYIFLDKPSVAFTKKTFSGISKTMVKSHGKIG